MNFNSSITSRFPALLRKNNKRADIPVIIFSKYRDAFKLVLDEGFGIAEASLLPAIIYSRYKNAYKLVWDEGFLTARANSKSER